MAIQTAAGATISMSASLPATYDAAGYTALTYTNVGKLSSLPEFGITNEVVTLDLMDSRMRIKRKGAWDGGDIGAEFAFDSADAGQALLKTASTSDNNYSFKVTDQDGTKTHFVAQVSDYRIDRSNANNFVMLKTKLLVTAPASGTNLFVYI